MYNYTAVTVVLLSCALFSAPSLSTAASPLTIPVLDNQNVEAAVEGQARRSGILEATRSKTRTSESTESVDCFYEANKAHTDCRDARAK